MLEQNETNEMTIEELKDIENKGSMKSEKLGERIESEECHCCDDSNGCIVTKPNFIDTLKASIIDLIAIGGISTVGVFMADSIIRLAGYGITEKFQMTFIIFMGVMVLYTSIMESGKISATLGKKIAGLIITKG